MDSLLKTHKLLLNKAFTFLALVIVTIAKAKEFNASDADAYALEHFPLLLNNEKTYLQKINIDTRRLASYKWSPTIEAYPVRYKHWYGQLSAFQHFIEATRKPEQSRHKIRVCYMMATTYIGVLADLRKYYVVRNLYHNHLDYEVGYMVHEVIVRYQRFLELFYIVRKKYYNNINTNRAPLKWMFYIYSNLVEISQAIAHYCNMLHELKEKYKVEKPSEVFGDESRDNQGPNQGNNSIPMINEGGKKGNKGSSKKISKETAYARKVAKEVAKYSSYSKRIAKEIVEKAGKDASYAREIAKGVAENIYKEVATQVAKNTSLAKGFAKDVALGVAKDIKDEVDKLLAEEATKSTSTTIGTEVTKDTTKDPSHAKKIAMGVTKYNFYVQRIVKEIIRRVAKDTPADASQAAAKEIDDVDRKKRIKDKLYKKWLSKRNHTKFLWSNVKPYKNPRWPLIYGWSIEYW